MLSSFSVFTATCNRPTFVNLTFIMILKANLTVSYCLVVMQNALLHTYHIHYLFKTNWIMNGMDDGLTLTYLFID